MPEEYPNGRYRVIQRNETGNTGLFPAAVEAGRYRSLDDAQRALAAMERFMAQQGMANALLIQEVHSDGSCTDLMDHDIEARFAAAKIL